jgi:hypothetical protein
MLLAAKLAIAFFFFVVDQKRDQLNYESYGNAPPPLGIS